MPSQPHDEQKIGIYHWAPKTYIKTIVANLFEVARFHPLLMKIARVGFDVAASSLTARDFKSFLLARISSKICA